LSARDALRDFHRAALDAVHAGRALERALAARDPGPGPFVLLAAGKAACAMAEAALRRLGPRIARGRVTTKDGHARALSGLVVREAAHPLPDARSESAGREALALAGSLAGAEELLVLISGGASALWCVPAEGLSLADKRAASEALLRSPADIHELNTVRRHLSALKGGGLARAAHGRRIHAYAVSDVRGDAPHEIGSGPVSADPSSARQALAVLDRHSVRVPDAVRRRLLTQGGPAGGAELSSVSFEVVASLDAALEAARRAAEAHGLRVCVLREGLYGEVEAVARGLAAQARAHAGALVIAGGEPTVRVRGAGQGGRAQELALRLALELTGSEFVALCAGSDGSDGATPAAGGFSDSSTLRRAAALGRPVAAALAQSDSHGLLKALGDLCVTGPTDTNVTDLAFVQVTA